MGLINLAVLISGTGTNLKAIIDAIDKQKLNANIQVVISNNINAKGLAHAKQRGIKTCVCIKDNTSTMNQKIIDELGKYQIDLIVLAGFLGILSSELINKYKNKIINIHPSLLPKYGGKGMYGIHVHQTVINNHEKYSGCTTHYVNEGIDEGEIIFQKKVKIHKKDDAQTLAKRVLKKEHKLLVKTIKYLSKNIKN